MSSNCSLTFCSVICDDALLNRFERTHSRGALQHAHLPLSPQFAVPCGAPDVACRIIHTHALMKVSIWPHMHTLSPHNHICMWKWEKKQGLQSCSGISTAEWASNASSLVSIETLRWCTGDTHLAMAERWHGEGIRQQTLWRVRDSFYMSNGFEHMQITAKLPSSYIDASQWLSNQRKGQF